MAGNCQMAMAMKPAASARTDLSSLAQTKLLLFSARRGRHAWPSWDMQLARSTGNGRIPDANIDTKTMCGPDSGMSPVSTAMTIISPVFPRSHVSMSMRVDKMPNMARTPKVHAKITGRCLFITCPHTCSFMKCMISCPSSCPSS